MSEFTLNMCTLSQVLGKLVQIFKTVFIYFSVRLWGLQMKVHTLPINERVPETV